MRYTTSDMKRNIKTLLLLSFATAASLCSINLLADDDISMPGMEMPLGIPSLTPVNAASTDSLTATEENTDSLMAVRRHVCGLKANRKKAIFPKYTAASTLASKPSNSSNRGNLNMLGLKGFCVTSTAISKREPSIIPAKTTRPEW